MPSPEPSMKFSPIKWECPICCEEIPVRVIEVPTVGQVEFLILHVLPGLPLEACPGSFQTGQFYTHKATTKPCPKK